MVFLLEMLGLAGLIVAIAIAYYIMSKEHGREQ